MLRVGTTASGMGNMQTGCSCTVAISAVCTCPGDVKPECDHCLDNPTRKCKHCACCVCGEKRDPDKQLACDECDEFYHLWCLSPPLDDIPEEEEW